MAASAIHCRPSGKLDYEFLYDLHVETMRAYISATWGWDDAWQRRDFDRRLQSQEVEIVEAQGEMTGSVWWGWQPESLYVHQLSILPRFQRRGFGTGVIAELLGRASEHGKTVALSVLEANPLAKRLYERVGFTVTCVEPPFIRMEHSNGRVT